MNERKGCLVGSFDILEKSKSVWTKYQCCIRFSSRTPGDVSINEFRQVWLDQMGSVLKAHVPFMKTSSVQRSIEEWISGRLDDLSKLDTKSCRAHHKSFTQLYKFQRVSITGQNMPIISGVDKGLIGNG